MSNVRVDQLASAIDNELKMYHEDTVKRVKNGTKQCMKKLVDLTKEQRYLRDKGDFRNAISSKTLNEDINGIKMVWYVKPPHYRLAHLLEDGHAKANQYGRSAKGKTVAYHFIQKSRDTVEKYYDRLLKEVLK